MKHLTLVVALGVAACVSGTPRPVPPAAEFNVTGSPPEALSAALAAVTQQGLPLRTNDQVAGLVETDYVDLAEYYSQATAAFTQAERLVRFRLMVAPAEVGYGSTVAIEARYSPFSSVAGGINRRRERAIPRDHPGMLLVAELQRTIQARADRP